MYLTSVEINSNNRQKYRELGHVGAIHSWVERCFPEEFTQGVRSRKLWRVDTLNKKEYLLVLSESEPDSQVLTEYGVVGSAKTLDYTKMLDTLKEGQECQFRVVLTPTVRLSQRVDTTRAREVACVTEEQQLDYLHKRAEKNGFSLDTNQVSIVKKDFVRYGKKGQREMDLIQVAYEGRLVISDLEKFKHTLTEGMGRKRAYGFGLMTVIPV